MRNSSTVHLLLVFHCFRINIRGKQIEIPINSSEKSDSDSENSINEIPSEEQLIKQIDEECSKSNRQSGQDIEDEYFKQGSDSNLNTEEQSSVGVLTEITNTEENLQETVHNLEDVQQKNDNGDLEGRKNEDNLTVENEKDGEAKEKRLSRKRTRNPDKWACNIRKENYDRGLEYITSRKKVRPARKIETKKDCIAKCLYKCGKKISEEQRKEIFENYYKLNAKEKRMFIVNTTEMIKPERRRKGKNSENSRKGNSYKYFFIIDGTRIQVCKLFYCGTLGISQKPVYTVHKHKTATNTLRSSNQGKHKKRVTSDEAANLVRQHINLFPRIESHYCRANTKREYLEGDLSIAKLYELYTDYIAEKGFEPVKMCIYRKIFCTEFNISFNKPSKDRCDICGEVELRNKEKTMSKEKQDEYDKHMQEKLLMREEKKRDKDSGKAILCFDLENVLTCPKGDFKNFFYKSKMNVYNMTAHLSVNKTVYCAVWSEAIHGRAGNDIASAVYKILNKILEDYPLLEELVLWSDSCVPQNRNSLMSYGIAHTLQKNPHLKKITMKFSVPGHSCVQEVDSVHSAIERSLRKTEYSSPVSLLRKLLKVNSRKPYKVLQMQDHDFLDFNSYSMKMNYSTVPFSKVVALEFSSMSFYEIKYKTSFSESDYKVVCLKKTSGRNSAPATSSADAIPVTLRKSDAKASLPQNKIVALKSMYPWMTDIDKQYYETVFAKISTKTKK